MSNLLKVCDIRVDVLANEGNCATGSVMWRVDRVNGQFGKRVRVAWASDLKFFPQFLLVTG